MLNSLLIILQKKNFVVASIKHAHHNFDIDQQGTDSFLYRKAGSQQVIVSSSKRWAKIIELNNKNEKKLNDLLEELESPDIVIIEGFKHESHPKIEIIKEGSFDYLFPKLKNIIAVISNKKIDTLIPQFTKKDIDKVVEYILNNSKQ